MHRGWTKFFSRRSLNVLFGSTSQFSLQGLLAFQEEAVKYTAPIK